MQITSLHGWRLTEYSQGTAAGIDFDLLNTNFTMQLVFVKLFQAELADVRGTRVIDLAHLTQITLVDTVKSDFADMTLKNISGIVDPSKIRHVVINHIENDHIGLERPYCIDQLDRHMARGGLMTDVQRDDTERRR